MRRHTDLGSFPTESYPTIDNTIQTHCNNMQITFEDHKKYVLHSVCVCMHKQDLIFNKHYITYALKTYIVGLMHHSRDGLTVRNVCYSDFFNCFLYKKHQHWVYSKLEREVRVLSYASK